MADPEHQLLEPLGLWGEKKFAGKTYMGATRTTYLVGVDGNIEHVWENAKAQGHAAAVLEHCEEG